MAETAVAIREADAVVAWTPRQLLAQVDLIQQVMREAMRSGEHYGVIPGTERKDKDGKDISNPSLLQPGAQKLCMTFRLVPTYTVIQTDLPGDHREYRIGCVLTSIQTGAKVGEGVGTCSTRESKYRWRKSERTCPACGKSSIIKGKKEYGGGWLCFAKRGGCGAKYQDDDAAITAQMVGQMENPDIADTYNTVLKMGKKRAFVDATIQALAVSDLFTQDMEDFTPDPPVPSPTEKVTEGEVVEPEKKVDLPPVDYWAEQYAKAITLKDFLSLEHEIEPLWKQYSGEKKTALKFIRDKTKAALTEAAKANAG